MTAKYIIAVVNPKEKAAFGFKIRTCADEQDLIGWLNVLKIDDMDLVATLKQMQAGASGKLRTMWSYDGTYCVKVMRLDVCIREMIEKYDKIAPESPFYYKK